MVVEKNEPESSDETPTSETSNTSTTDETNSAEMSASTIDVNSTSQVDNQRELSIPLIPVLFAIIFVSTIPFLLLRNQL